jgi:adenylate cyclase
MEGLSEKLLKLIPNFARSFGVLTIIAIASGGLVLSFFAKMFPEDTTGPWVVPKVLAENFDSIEEKFFDWRNNYYLFEKNNKDRPPKKLTKGPIFIDIDDKSLTEIGTFPLPREYYIQMLDKLEQFGAKVVAFDVLFPEKSLSCDMGDGKTVDDLFAERVASFNASDKAGSVVLAFTAQDASQKDVERIEPDIVLLSSILSARGLYDQDVKNEDETIEIPRTKLTEKVVEKGLFPFRELADTDSTFGFLNMEEDRDGVFRQYAVFARVMSKEILEGSMLLPSLGLQAYMASLDQNELNFEVDQFSTTLNINNKNLYIDERGEVKIKWIGNRYSFPAISFMDLLTAKKPEDLKNKYLIDKYNEHQNNLKKKDLKPTERKEIEKKLKQIEPFVKVDLKDKIVFVASSSTGYHDLRNTPVDGTMPGVYAHMTVTHMLQNQNFFQNNGDSIFKSGYLLFGTLTILLMVMFFNKAVFDLLTLMVLLIGSFFLDQYYFLPESYEMRLGQIFLEGIIHSLV